MRNVLYDKRLVVVFAEDETSTTLMVRIPNNGRATNGEDEARRSSAIKQGSSVSRKQFLTKKSIAPYYHGADHCLESCRQAIYKGDSGLRELSACNVVRTALITLQDSICLCDTDQPDWTGTLCCVQALPVRVTWMSFAPFLKSNNPRNSRPVSSLMLRHHAA